MDQKGRTALSYAGQYGSTDCIHTLAAVGADVFHADDDGKTPLMLAEESARTTAVDALKKLQVRVSMRERKNKSKQKQESANPVSWQAGLGGGGPPRGYAC